MATAESRITLETDEVRIREWRLWPGSATDCRRHDCDLITISLTRGLLRILGPGEERVIESVPGAVTLHNALCEHREINEGVAAVSFIEIELKNTVRRLISG
jgi:hypothetical protein